MDYINCGTPCLLLSCNSKASKSVDRLSTYGVTPAQIPAAGKPLPGDFCLALNPAVFISAPFPLGRPAVPHHTGFLRFHRVRVHQTLWETLLPNKAHKGMSQLMQTSSKDTLGTKLWCWIIEMQRFLTPHIISEDTPSESVPTALLHHSLFLLNALPKLFELSTEPPECLMF